MEIEANNHSEISVGFLLKGIDDLSKKEMIEFIDKELHLKVVDFCLPKKSKIFSTNHVKMLFSKRSIRERVILSHLFFENMMEEIINNKFPKPEKVLDNTFSKKLDILYSLDYISNENYQTLKLINNIRNNFAHDLRYDIGKFQIERFPGLKKVKLINYKRQKDKEKYNDFLLTFCSFLAIISLEREHPFIRLMDY